MEQNNGNNDANGVLEFEMADCRRRFEVQETRDKRDGGVKYIVNVCGTFMIQDLFQEKKINVRTVPYIKY